MGSIVLDVEVEGVLGVFVAVEGSCCMGRGFAVFEYLFRWWGSGSESLFI